jgi:hypothetical protein
MRPSSKASPAISRVPCSAAVGPPPSCKSRAAASS